MTPARKDETLSVELAYLESRLQQLTEECRQIDQWLSADQAFLTLLQQQNEQLCSLLTVSDASDQQIRHALNELAVIGQVQIFLLGQTMQREARSCTRLEDERGKAQRSMALLASLIV